MDDICVLFTENTQVQTCDCIPIVLRLISVCSLHFHHAKF